MYSVAAIDIGSNSVRLLIVGPDGAEICREMNVTRLAEGVDQSGRLGESAIERTLSVLQQYGALMRGADVQRARVTGTSAARDAANRQEFFDLVKEAVGSAPELLSGQAEAALAFAGARHGRPNADAPFVTLDIGGGSTELAYGTTSSERSVSLDIGCVRLTERFLQADPPSAGQLDAAQSYVRSLLDRVDREVRPREAKTWLGLAGTITSLAARDAGLRSYDPSRTDGYVLGREQVNRMHQELALLTSRDRAALLLEPKRAGVILGGSIILVEVMRFFDLAQITASERDILDGLAASLREP
jgi:exopolyphosphatase / guanosine-5'-triphosphate,3'-diphosphate pyrophosphatase